MFDSIKLSHNQKINLDEKVINGVHLVQVNRTSLNCSIQSTSSLVWVSCFKQDKKMSAPIQNYKF